jgi:hypothetical protein
MFSDPISSKIDTHIMQKVINLNLAPRVLGLGVGSDPKKI